MSDAVLIAIVGAVSGILGGLVTSFLNKPKTAAESRKIDSEARKSDAEAEHLQAQTDLIEVDATQKLVVEWRMLLEHMKKENLDREVALLKEIDDLKLRVAGLESKLVQYNAVLRENDEMKKEIEGLQKENETLRAENKALRAELKAARADTAVLKAELEELRAKLVRLERKQTGELKPPV